jgi:IclR family KDG regulon transcriptional repressor
LFALAKGESGLTVGQLAATIDLPISTVYRFLQALEQRGLVRRCGENNYGLGPTVFNLSRAALKQIASDLPSVALPQMQLLTQRTGETSILAVPSEMGAICVQVVHSSKPIHFSFEIGRVLPYHAGATAVTLLAHLDDATAQRVIASNNGIHYAHGGPVDFDTLARTLQQCRQQGYIITRGEVDPNATGIGVPIFNHQGTIMATLTLAGPTDRFSTDSAPNFINQVKKTAHEIQIQLHSISV